MVINRVEVQSINSMLYLGKDACDNFVSRDEIPHIASSQPFGSQREFTLRCDHKRQTETLSPSDLFLLTGTLDILIHSRRKLSHQGKTWLEEQFS